MKKDPPISTIKWLGHDRDRFFTVLESAQGGYDAMKRKLSELCPTTPGHETPLSAVYAAVEIHQEPERFDWEKMYRDLISPADNEHSIFRMYDADPRAWRAIENDFTSRFVEKIPLSSTTTLQEWYETLDSDSARPWRHHSGQYSKLEWDIPEIPADYILTGYFVVAGTHHYQAAIDDFIKPGVRWISLLREPENRYDQNAISVIGGIRRGEETGYHHIGYVPRNLAETLAQGGLLKEIVPLVYKFEQKPDSVFFSVAVACSHDIAEKLTSLRVIR